jgi:hypothetical protein
MPPKVSEEVRQNFFEIVEEKGGEVLGDYIDTRTKIKIKC